MRKALLPMIASLALCGAATAALIATNASAAQSARKPMMVAFNATGANDDTAAPKSDGGAPPDAMMRRGMREQFCKDMYARRVGELAYFEAKLSLTSAQAPLFESWKQVTLDIAKRHSDECGQRGKLQKAGMERKMPSLIDGMNRQEDRLKKRLADLDAERPPLEALYNSLDTRQKMELGHGIRGLMRMHGMMEHRMGGHGMMGRRMMMGMMGRPHDPEMGPPPGMSTGMAPPSQQ